MRKYNIGYTNGVFDLFHTGHLDFLEKCKEYCDHLIVAVCEDDLVFENKGKYPIIPVKERIRILKGIKYVDEVVLQTTTDRISEWEKYHFNIFFHGIDGKNWDIEHGYYDALKKLGVELIYFDRATSMSTTLIINKILSRYIR